MAALGAVGGLLLGRGGSASGPSTPSTVSSARLKLVASKAGWSLGAPVSGQSMVAQDGKLIVIGGLDSAGSSATGVFTVDPRTGRASSTGTLAEPLHDAAAVALPNRTLVFGGGSATSTANVEALPSQGAGRVTGRLPTARSDLAAQVVGGRAYVLGGYDGQALEPAVLETVDGRRFRSVATLPVPVRYPAVAASGRSIYVFGGQTGSGVQTDAIQRIDVASGDAATVGHLPTALSHASAATIGGRVYVLGGSHGGKPTDRILSFDPATGRARIAGHLPTAVSNAAAAVVGGVAYLVGGVGTGGAPLSSVETVRLKRVTAALAGAATSRSTASTTSAAGDTTPFEGELLIADRGNNRLLLVDAGKHILWRYPSRSRPAPKGGFYFPDDAFFIRRGTGIISNEEGNDTVVEIAYPSGKVIWSYGHPRTPGATTGYLNQPDDAYLLRDRTVVVADARNCRVLFIGPSGQPANQVGTSGNCAHNPPRSLAYPNGDTPLANGDLLISEVNGSYVDEVTRSGKLVWSVHLPIAYPSDPQQLGPNRYLVADYSRPGGIYEFNRQGKILWSYHPPSGSGMLDHPSLAERLPNGLIATNDDYRDRVAIIDPRTKRIVWQYGRTDHPGTGPDRLKIPDGFDLLQSGGVTPTHPHTG
jgi:N-acetylneuraminic acid mutarotase